MKYCVIALLIVGAQAAQLSQKTEEDNAQEDTYDMTIKMPALAEPDTGYAMKPKSTSLSLVQAETGTQLGMFESGVLHASLKPILKAKVNKVMNFLQSTATEYEHGTVDQKSAIMSKAESLIMKGATTRGFNVELCNLLWGQATEESSTLSFYYCPTLVFPAQHAQGGPSYQTLQGEGPSRLRSAFLAQAFWRAVLGGSGGALQDKVIEMLGSDVCYYWGNVPGVCGKESVARTLPYIGFPAESRLSNVVHWHCDTTSCLTPITAWAKSENYCLVTFGAGGKVSEVIIPLSLWR